MFATFFRGHIVGMKALRLAGGLLFLRLWSAPTFRYKLLGIGLLVFIQVHSAADFVGKLCQSILLGQLHGSLDGFVGLVEFAEFGASSGQSIYG